MGGGKHYWMAQLEGWTRSGVFERIDDAKDNGTVVEVWRSDGTTSDAVIIGCGFGGRTVEVKILCDPPLYKSVRTEVFLEDNPSFGPSLIVMTPLGELSAAERARKVSK